MEVGVGLEVGVDPVVNVDVNGTNGWPVTSLTPLVTWNVYLVFAASRLVGWRTRVSPPPLVLTVAGMAAPSLVRISLTLVELTVLELTPPLGSCKSVATAVSRDTFVAPLPGRTAPTDGWLVDSEAAAVNTVGARTVCEVPDRRARPSSVSTIARVDLGAEQPLEFVPEPCIFFIVIPFQPPPAAEDPSLLGR